MKKILIALSIILAALNSNAQKYPKTITDSVKVFWDKNGNMTTEKYIHYQHEKQKIYGRRKNKIYT